MEDRKALERKIARFELLKSATTKPQLAEILKLKPVFLTRVIYKTGIEGQYYQFKISKKTGGHREITAPNDELKEIQSKLSDLLLDCIDAINSKKEKPSSLSHGFSRGKSIITNATKHKNKKNVFNIDIKDYFDSFNFGRVRGFFIKNRNFELDENVATAIAKISCYDNRLPQGSPCSPVISNLIAHSMDIRLAKLAHKHGLTYTRYADDITFSTNKIDFPKEIAKKQGHIYTIGRALKREIHRSGFEINEMKTRVQYCNSRQDVTGLVVNNKVSVKREYWRTERAKCHQLFMTGDIPNDGDKNESLSTKINRLSGRLAFIDSIDKFNRINASTIEHSMISKKAINGALKKEAESVIGNGKGKIKNKNKDKIKTKSELNKREETYSRFLFYVDFYANPKPTIICEGKTDNIYLSCAIKSLAQNYPALVKKNTENNDLDLSIKFYNYSKKTRHLLNLYGGTNYIKDLISNYCEYTKYYKAPTPKQPVIIVLDNDSGSKGPHGIFSLLKNEKLKNCPNTVEEIRKNNFTYIYENLYLVLTPLDGSKDTCMEDFFDEETLSKELNGKKFDPDNDKLTHETYGKHYFSTHVIKANWHKISFKKFSPILDRINAAIADYQKKS